MTAKGDWSFEDLARASNGTPQGARWWQLASEPLKSAPEARTVKGIARALGCSEHIVWDSIGESLGLSVEHRESRLLQMMPAGTEDLPDDAIASVLSLVRLLVRQAQALDERAGPDAGSPKGE